MKARLYLVLVVALVIGVIAFFYFRWERGAEPVAAGDEVVAQTNGEAPKDGRTILPQKFPEEKTEVGSPEEPPKSRFAMVIEDEPALSGIEFAASTDEDRKRAGVTGQYGQGVTVNRIHPDSSAAEVSMEVGDVIVRAQKENVNSVEDLKRIVGARDHIVVNFMRQGQLMSVVLQKPYEKPSP